MGFIYTLDPGPTDVSDKPVKCFSECAQRTPCIRICWVVRSESLGLEPRSLHSDPSPGDSDPQQSYNSIYNGVGRGGMEKSCPEWQEAQREEREAPGYMKVLTMSSHPSCFSHDSPYNLA